MLCYNFSAVFDRVRVVGQQILGFAVDLRGVQVVIGNDFLCRCIKIMKLVPPNEIHNRIQARLLSTDHTDRS